MFTDTVTYEDFNGNSRTESLYFNLSVNEMFDLENSLPGGYSAAITNAIDSHESMVIFDMLRDLIRRSYGTKSEDGTRFLKSKEEFEAFSQSPAYDAFLEKIISDNGTYAAKFVEGIMPRSILERVKTDPSVQSSRQELMDKWRQAESNRSATTA